MAALTVLMPAYNAGPFLVDAVRSVLAQDLGDFRLLLLDDGSTDGAVEQLATLNDQRIVVSRSATNLGLGATLSRGLEECETEYFARMDADDIIAPSRFRLQLAFLRRNGDVGMVGTQFHYFGKAGAKVHSPRMPLAHDDIFRGLQRRELTLIHGSLMGRVDTLRAAGGYRVRGMGEDWDMFLRVGEAARLANLPDDLYAWRLHGGNARVAHLMEQQLGIRYACDCAERRARGLPEPEFDPFARAQQNAPMTTKVSRYVDAFSLAQYRIALTSISNGDALRGYARLAFAAACSPARLVRRIGRLLRDQTRVAN